MIVCRFTCCCFAALVHPSFQQGTITDTVQVAGLAKELKRERLALSRAQQVPLTRASGGNLPLLRNASLDSLLTKPVLETPPAPVAPAIVQKAPTLEQKAENQPGTRLAQQAEQGEGVQDMANTLTDAE
jgi:hypothetical protein